MMKKGLGIKAVPIFYFTMIKDKSLFFSFIPRGQ